MKNRINQQIFPIVLSAFMLLLAAKVQAVACSVPISGNVTLLSSCSFSSAVNGVDAGTGSTNSATLTVSSSATLTVGTVASQTIARGTIVVSPGGAIILNKGVGAKIVKMPLWMIDVDGDGYPESLSQIAQTSAPQNGFRRNIMNTTTSTDCNASSSLVGRIATCYQPGTGTSTSMCVGSSCNALANSVSQPCEVFATKGTYNGAIGRLGQADAICQGFANDYNLGAANWKAWMTDASTTSISSRFSSNCGSQNTRGYVTAAYINSIATSWTDLKDGTLANPIKYYLTGDLATSVIWTGTNYTGTLYSSSYTCRNWTSSSTVDSSYYGFSAYTNSYWSAYSRKSCDNILGIYCFEQDVDPSGYSLAVQVGPYNAATLTASGGTGPDTSINCGNGNQDCTARYYPGSTLVITASATSSSLFWVGCSSVIADNQCQLIMTKDRSLYYGQLSY